MEEFDERACVLKSVLRFLRGPLQDRNACRIGRDQYRGFDLQESGWKFLMFPPRMLLHRFLKRVIEGGAKDLSLTEERGPVSWRRTCHQAAEALVHVGELSSA